jgi:hypothetical protein
MRYASGSKNRRSVGVQPDPGPPCSPTTGRPTGLPLTSQYTRFPSPVARWPDSYGSVAGYKPPTGPDANGRA